MHSICSNKLHRKTLNKQKPKGRDREPFDLPMFLKWHQADLVRLYMVVKI